MEITNIKIRRNLFISATGKNVKKITPTEFEDDEWKCKVKTDGTIECNLSKECYEGILSVKLIVTPDGNSTFTRKITNKRTKIFRYKAIKNKGNRLNGSLLLIKDDKAEEYYAYFFSYFNNFMHNLEIKNIQFSSKNEVDGNYKLSKGSAIYSDGNKSFVQYCNEYGCKITNATWVLIIYRGSDNGCLFTSATDLFNVYESLIENKYILQDKKKRDKSLELETIDGSIVTNISDVKEVLQEAYEIEPNLNIQYNPEKLKKAFGTFKKFKASIEAFDPLIRLDDFLTGFEINLVFVDENHNERKRINLVKGLK